MLILTSNTPPPLGIPETENQDEYLSSLCLPSPSHGLLGPEMGRFPASTIQASWPSCHRQNQTLHAWKQFYDLSPTYKLGCLASYAKWELNNLGNPISLSPKPSFYSYYAYKIPILGCKNLHIRFFFCIHAVEI